MRPRVPHITLLLAFLALILPGKLNAQFLQFTLEVEPEVRANVAQPLNFGTVLTKSGKITIEPGSPRMGIFEITGLNNQYLQITLDYPKELKASESGDVIPMEFEARYTTSSDAPFEAAKNFTGNSAGFEIGDAGVSSAKSWEVVRVFVYGSADVQNVAEGVYKGSILMQVIVN